MEITITNESAVDLVVLSFSASDTIQAFPFHQKKITSSSCVSVQGPDAEFVIHVYSPGLFGLVSMRTRLTAGYGYKVIRGASYRLRMAERNERGNHCILECNGVIAEHKQYIFGDMLLRPILKSIGIIDFNFRGDAFASYLSKRQTARWTSFDSSDNENLNEFSCIPEDEMWGVFFEQVAYAGISALRDGLITRDDLEMQEPYLFIGLPSLSLCNTVFRRPQDSHCLTFIDGRRITRETCPPALKELFDMLLNTKVLLSQLPSLSDHEKRWTKHFLVYAASKCFEKQEGRLHLI